MEHLSKVSTAAVFTNMSMIVFFLGKYLCLYVKNVEKWRNHISYIYEHMPAEDNWAKELRKVAYVILCHNMLNLLSIERNATIHLSVSFCVNYLSSFADFYIIKTLVFVTRPRWIKLFIFSEFLLNLLRGASTIEKLVCIQKICFGKRCLL